MTKKIERRLKSDQLIDLPVGARFQYEPWGGGKISIRTLGRWKDFNTNPGAVERFQYEPWGGGKTIESFVVSIDDIKEALKNYL